MWTLTYHNIMQRTVLQFLQDEAELLRPDLTTGSFDFFFFFDTGFYHAVQGGFELTLQPTLPSNSQ